MLVQAECESGALAFGAAECDLTAMRRDDLFGDAQAQSDATFCILPRYSEKFLEYSLLVFAGDAATIVCNCKQNLSSFHFRRQPYHAADMGVFDGVGKQVGEYIQNAGTVGAYIGQIGGQVDFKANPPVLGLAKEPMRPLLPLDYRAKQEPDSAEHCQIPSA